MGFNLSKNAKGGAICYGPYQISVITTQSRAWGVSGCGMGHDRTNWTMWQRMVTKVI